MDYWWNVGFEVIKLAVQFVGAMLIARLAVKWALTRYKSEKHWERRMAAYSDLVSALNNMIDVVNRWNDNLYNGEEVTVQEKEYLDNKYKNYAAKIDEARATSKLLLPDTINIIIEKLVIDLAGIPDDHKDISEELQEELGVLRGCREKVVNFGRADLALKLNY